MTNGMKNSRKSVSRWRKLRTRQRIMKIRTPLQLWHMKDTSADDGQADNFAMEQES
jgi:hypothetical protein